MIVFRAGEPLGEKNLGQVLRERWNDNRAHVLSAIDKRTKAGVPLDDGDGPLRDPGEYDGDPELDDVTIEVVALSVADHQSVTSRLVEASRAIEGKTGADGDAARAAEMLVVREALDLSLRKVAGMTDSDGAKVSARHPLSDNDWAMLGASGLITPLLSACMYVQGLRGAKKKTCGASRRSTSVSSTVIDALSLAAENEAVTMTQPPSVGRA